MRTDRKLLEEALEYIPDGMKLYDDFRAEIRARLAEDDDEPVPSSVELTENEND